MCRTPSLGRRSVHGMINLALAELNRSAYAAGAAQSVPYGDLLVALAERLGLRLTERALAAALEAEADWVSDVLPVGREEWLYRLRALMEAPPAALRTLPEVIGRYQARLADVMLRWSGSRGRCQGAGRTAMTLRPSWIGAAA